MTDYDCDPARHYRRDLVGLDPNGWPCEACNRAMHDHEWVDLDEWGLVVSCVFEPGSGASGE